MSKKNNKNNKSTVPAQVQYVVLPKLPQIPQQSRSAVRNSNVKSKDLSYKSTQPRSKKSQTGAAYNDGFDVRNQPVKPKVRFEDFDEICFTVLGTVNYATSELALNPAQVAVFPRLSNFAKLYDRYKFTKLEAYFLHDVSQFADQGSKGLIILSALFDAASALPITKQEQEMCNPHVIAMPNQNALLKVDVSRLHPSGYPLYTRPGVKPGATDIKTYDAGKIVIGTQGMVNNTEIGEIHIRGTVAFYDEIVDLNRNPVVQDNTTKVTYNDNTLANGIGKTLVPTFTSNPLGISITGDVLYFPPGDYLLSYKQDVFSAAASMHQASAYFLRNGAGYGTQASTNALLGTVSFYNLENSLVNLFHSDLADSLQILATASFPSGTISVAGILIIEKL